MTSLKANLFQHSVLFAAASLLLLFVIAVFFFSVSANDGKLVYTFDDAYIHMAMAKNLELHGVWGITKHGFTSCSSSLLWTSLIASVYLVFGLNEITPFVLNLLASFLVVISLYFIYRRCRIGKLYSLLSLALLILITPIIPLIFSGLEHVLHILVSILYVYYASEIIAGLRKNYADYTMLLLLSILLPVLRYEGLVLVFIGCVLLLYRKKPLLSVVCFLCGTLPIFIFGLISISKGWSFFPNSLIMKGDFPDVTSLNSFFVFLLMLLSKLITPFKLISLSACLVLVIYGFLRFRKSKISVLAERDIVMMFFLIVNIILYYLYSKSGWSYRYQSFLVAMAIFVLTVVVFSSDSRILPVVTKKTPLRIFGCIILLAAIIFQGAEAYNTIKITPQSTTNIYQQQYQMGLFVKRFYDNKAVALNDIGTSSYFADIELVDLWGLANIEVSKLRRNNLFSENEIRRISKTTDLKIAIVYDSWFTEGDTSIIPREWIKAGEWKIENNYAASDDVVSIYAADLKEELNLISNLKAFSSSLPPQVIQSGKYTLN